MIKFVEQASEFAIITTSSNHKGAVKIFEQASEFALTITFSNCKGTLNFVESANEFSFISVISPLFLIGQER